VVSRKTLAAFLIPALSYAATGIADIARGIREVELDPAECYRVHDVQINRDDIHLYFTDGYIIFGKPVGGIHTTAVFTDDVEAGDAELLLLPPIRSERQSLASYTGSPNLDEHFSAAVLLFGDNTYDALIQQIRANPFNKRSPEMGALMPEQWNSVVRNLSTSFEERLLLDVLSPARRQDGCLLAAMSGKKLGSFDVIYEPRAFEQVAVGQLNSRSGFSFFDVWTSFEAAPYRRSVRKYPGPEVSLKDYRIDATLEPSLNLRVITKVKVTVAAPSERVLPFDITSRMNVSSATIDGVPAEVLQSESLRSNLMRYDGSNLFLLIAAQPLQAGHEYDVEFHHEGQVVEDAGNQVYFVGARGTWYPNSGMQFAKFDLRFSYPKDLDLVAPGAVVSDKTENGVRITRRLIDVPIRFAGFNLGVYDRVRVEQKPYTIEVCANRAIEAALKTKPQALITGPRVGRRPGAISAPLEPIPSPAARLEELAAEIASAFEFMAARFGPPPLRTLEVSPIPGAFGQGFPGMLYLSTRSYLQRHDEALVKLDPQVQSFFTDLLQAHETAHQWWGNVVTTDGYHDEWLMESLANYSALMYLEKHSGRSLMDAALGNYRSQLLTKNQNGQTVESGGPIVLGHRLESSHFPSAYLNITYGKGSWIMHMLRGLMGEDRFVAMLGELRRRYQGKTISTDEFRELAAGFLPPKSPDAKLEAFFDQWVYGTGIPTFKLSYTTQGHAPAVKLTGTISQSDVDSEFSVQVPVEIECGRTRQVKWVRTSGSSASFTVTLPQMPTKVALDTSNILAANK
jgi:peptidase M1-like protein